MIDGATVVVVASGGVAGGSDGETGAMVGDVSGDCAVAGTARETTPTTAATPSARSWPNRAHVTLSDATGGLHGRE